MSFIVSRNAVYNCCVKLDKEEIVENAVKDCTSCSPTALVPGHDDIKPKQSTFVKYGQI